MLIAFADMQGILPGEPDPNGAPGRERIYRNGKVIGEYTLDDTKCPKGKRAFLKMKCGAADEELQCEKYSPSIECRAKARRFNCKKPKTLVPVLSCD